MTRDKAKRGDKEEEKNYNNKETITDYIEKYKKDYDDNLNKESKHRDKK